MLILKLLRLASLTLPETENASVLSPEAPVPLNTRSISGSGPGITGELPV